MIAPSTALSTECRSRISGAEAVAQGPRHEVINPATGHICTWFHAATFDDIDTAVAFASQRQVAWALTEPNTRADLLRAVANAIDEAAEELSQLDCTESGRVLTSLLNDDVPTAAEAFRDAAARLEDQKTRKFDADDVTVIERAIPHGVCVGLGAWNYPLQIAAAKIAPALAQGNTMVFKPSPQTPSSVTHLAMLIDRVATSMFNILGGLVQVVHGGAETGATLVDDSRVRHVSLTGGLATGEHVYAAAARGIRRITLELGGASSIVVLDDADLEVAVRASLQANFVAQGQLCTAAARIYVAEALYPEFVSRFVERVRALRVGHPQSPSTQIGPLISKAHRARVHAFVLETQQLGATVLVGGHVCDEEAFAEGAYYAPTVLVNVPPSARILRDEIFGPVVCVLRSPPLDALVSSLNAQRYGLAAGVIGRDVARAVDFAARLDVGVAWVNTYAEQPSALAFGGRKSSGIGREGGDAGFDAYAERVSIVVDSMPGGGAFCP